MGVCHWCDRCGWRDEDQMGDPRTCHCGERVDVVPPSEPFERHLARENARYARYEAYRRRQEVSPLWPVWSLIVFMVFVFTSVWVLANGVFD